MRKADVGRILESDSFMGDFVGYKYPTYKFWIRKGRLKIFQTAFF